MTRSTPPALYVRTGNAATPLALDDAVHCAGNRRPTRPDLLDALLGRHATHSPARGSRLTCVRLGSARHGRQR
jgi:hypothetical protein